MSVYDSDYAEQSRETNDLWFGAPDPPDWDEPAGDEDEEEDES